MAPARIRLSNSEAPLFVRPGFSGQLTGLRSAAWHTATFEAQEKLAFYARSSSRRIKATDPPFPMGWRLLPERKDILSPFPPDWRKLADPQKLSPQLDKLPTPRAARIEYYDEVLRGTRQVFHSDLWKALDSRLTLAQGIRLKQQLEVQQGKSLAALAGGRPQEADDGFHGSELLALTVIQLRISVSEQADNAFEHALRVLEALCCIALSRRFRSVVRHLGDYIEGALLRGLMGEDFRFRTRGAPAVGEALERIADRANRLELLAGYSTVDADQLEWATKVDMSLQLILAITRSYLPQGHEHLEWLWRMQKRWLFLEDREFRPIFELDRAAPRR